MQVLCDNFLSERMTEAWKWMRVGSADVTEQGWIVRPGSQYGMDYVLYSRHPSESHSSFCVRCLSGDRQLTWVDLQAAHRVCAQARPKRVAAPRFAKPESLNVE
jgi:tRNA-intron lyase